jgi:AraC family transcriptional regulator
MNSQRTILRNATFGSFTISDVAYSGGMILGSHAHATARFCAVLSGEYREELDGRQLHCTPGTVTFRPAGVMHANRFAAETRCLTIEPASSRCDDLLTRLHFTRNDRAFALATQIERELANPDAASELIIEGLLLQFAGVHARSNAAGHVPPWLVNVRRRLATTHRASLRELANECDVHPSYLATAFRRAFGCTIGEFRRQRRIDDAVAALSRRDLPLAQIALSCGFSDQSHFSREFKRAVGVTPAAFRRQQPRSKS